jgi:hypothetical protein
MAATLCLYSPPKPWHTVALAYFKHLPMSNGFDNALIVTDYLNRMAYF